MNLGKKLSVGAVAIGLAFGGFSLGACGSTSGQTKAAESSEKTCGASSCGGEKKADDKAKSASCGAASCGGEKKPEASSATCGEGSCS